MIFHLFLQISGSETTPHYSVTSRDYIIISTGKHSYEYWFWSTLEGSPNKNDCGFINLWYFFLCISLLQALGGTSILHIFCIYTFSGFPPNQFQISWQFVFTWERAPAKFENWETLISLSFSDVIMLQFLNYHDLFLKDLK